ncbi:MAG: hypothetical protein M5U28_03895 [Sandaracinaceae bacterium]|nr:hypothetical protein [Sandaracinaceae bacterium]
MGQAPVGDRVDHARGIGEAQRELEPVPAAPIDHAVGADRGRDRAYDLHVVTREERVRVRASRHADERVPVDPRGEHGAVVARRRHAGGIGAIAHHAPPMRAVTDGRRRGRAGRRELSARRGGRREERGRDEHAGEAEHGSFLSRARFR